MGTKVKLKDVRTSFVNDLWEKGEFQGRPTGYGVTLLIPPNHPQIKEIDDAVAAEKQAVWGGKKVRMIRDDPLHPCDEKEDFDMLDGDWLYIRANNKNKPTAFYGDELVETNDGRIYSGCWVDAIIEIYAQAHKSYGNNINVSLLGVKFRRDDEAFAGGRTASREDFEDDDDGPRRSPRGTRREYERDPRDAPRERDPRDAPRGRERDPRDAPRGRERDPRDAPRGRERDERLDAPRGRHTPQHDTYDADD